MFTPNLYPTAWHKGVIPPLMVGHLQHQGFPWTLLTGKSGEEPKKPKTHSLPFILLPNRSGLARGPARLTGLSGATQLGRESQGLLVPKVKRMQGDRGAGLLTGQSHQAQGQGGRERGPSPAQATEKREQEG